MEKNEGAQKKSRVSRRKHEGDSDHQLYDPNNDQNFSTPFVEKTICKKKAQYISSSEDNIRNDSSLANSEKSSDYQIDNCYCLLFKEVSYKNSGKKVGRKFSDWKTKLYSGVHELIKKRFPEIYQKFEKIQKQCAETGKWHRMKPNQLTNVVLFILFLLEKQSGFEQLLGILQEKFLPGNNSQSFKKEYFNRLSTFLHNVQKIVLSRQTRQSESNLQLELIRFYSQPLGYQNRQANTYEHPIIFYKKYILTILSSCLNLLEAQNKFYEQIFQCIWQRIAQRRHRNSSSNAVNKAKKKQPHQSLEAYAEKYLRLLKDEQKQENEQRSQPQPQTPIIPNPPRAHQEQSRVLSPVGSLMDDPVSPYSPSPLFFEGLFSQAQLVREARQPDQLEHNNQMESRDNARSVAQRVQIQSPIGCASDLIGHNTRPNTKPPQPPAKKFSGLLPVGSPKSGPVVSDSRPENFDIFGFTADQQKVIKNFSTIQIKQLELIFVEQFDNQRNDQLSRDQNQSNFDFNRFKNQQISTPTSQENLKNRRPRRHSLQKSQQENSCAQPRKVKTKEDNQI